MFRKPSGWWMFLLIGALGVAGGWQVRAAVADDPISEMTETAQRIVALLNDQQREACLMPLDGDQREFWNFVPDRAIQPGGKRLGLSISQMSVQQRLLTHALLSTALSSQGYRRTMSVMALEQVLFELENNNPTRNPQLYYLCVFGEPQSEGTWGWRFEGHHLSLNFTVVDGRQVSLTPSFFGANPAEVRRGELQGLRVLDGMEDVARAFVKSLSPQQQAKAVISAEVPSDIISQTLPRVTPELFAGQAGIGYDELQPDQQQELLRLVNEYAANYRPALLEKMQTSQPLTSGEGMRFVWIGDLEPGRGHYYRIQTPDFLFEYDNTQNDANHIHAVWRHFDGDFGRDLLQAHHREHHSLDAGFSFQLSHPEGHR